MYRTSDGQNGCSTLYGSRVSHFSSQLHFYGERLVWSGTYTGIAALVDCHEYPVPGSPVPSRYHAPRVARGANAPAFAEEGDKVVVSAVIAPGSAKAVGKDAAFRIAPKKYALSNLSRECVQGQPTGIAGKSAFLCLAQNWHECSHPIHRSRCCVRSPAPNHFRPCPERW